MRLCSALGHNQAAEWHSFKSGNHISDQHCSGGQGTQKKALGKVSSDILCMVNQTKKQQNKAFFASFVVRIVANFNQGLRSSLKVEGLSCEQREGNGGPEAFLKNFLRLRPLERGKYIFMRIRGLQITNFLLKRSLFPWHTCDSLYNDIPSVYLQREINKLAK